MFDISMYIRNKHFRTASSFDAFSFFPHLREDERRHAKSGRAEWSEETTTSPITGGDIFFCLTSDLERSDKSKINVQQEWITARQNCEISAPVTRR